MNTYKGIDLTNVNSIKVCVDIWDAVVNQKKYISIEDHNSAMDTLKAENGAKIAEFNGVCQRQIDDLNKQIKDLSANTVPTTPPDVSTEPTRDQVTANLYKVSKWTLFLSIFRR